MIISHKHKFIFVKTGKTAGTSIEVYLAQFCGEDDIITPIYPNEYGHPDRNHRGRFNPIPEILCNIPFRPRRLKRTAREFLNEKKFHPHIHARTIRARIRNTDWHNYLKFTIERNPWDKVVSAYYFNKEMGFIDESWDEYVEKRSFPQNHPRYTDCKGQNVIVDELLYYESLKTDLEYIIFELGIDRGGYNNRYSFDDIQAKSSIRPGKHSYREMYTDSQKRIVAEEFEKELALHGYEF